MKLSEKQLRSIIREAIINNKKNLSEGVSTDNIIFKKWDYLLHNADGLKLFNDIFDYLDEKTLEGLMDYLDKKGYFECSLYDPDYLEYLDNLYSSED